MEHILLYACIEKNFGDDLFIHTLCKRYPDHIFYISSDAKYGSLQNIPNLRFSRIFKIWQMASDTGNREGLKLAISNVIEKACRAYLERFRTSVYVVGNAFKCYDYRNKGQSDWFKKRVSLTKNFFLLSTNFGPYSDNRWLTEHKEHFRRATHVCFRDESSYDLFKELDNVTWAPDVVLSLGELRESKTRDKDQVIVSIIDCGFITRPDSVKKAQNGYEKKITEICIHYLQKSYEVKILTSNHEQDYPAARRIQEECNRALGRKPSIIEYDGNYENVFEEYRNSKYIIATRLHAIIAAWLCRLPIIPIVYDVKVRAVLESYGFDGLTLDLESISDVSVEEIDKALRNYDFPKLDELFIESNRQFEVLDKFLCSQDV